MKIDFNNDRKAGIIATVVFHVGLLIVFTLLSLKPPYPPAPQIYTEVDLGDSENGSGEIQPEKSASTPMSAPQPQSRTTEKVVTQENDATYSSSKNTKTNQTIKPVETPEPPKINNRAMFSSEKIKSNGGSQGDTKGSGDRGVQGGTPNSPNYTGTPGTGNTVGFDLRGRTKRKLPAPAYDGNEQGTVVVKIWVDKNGQVTAAEAGARGSNTTNSRLYSLAYNAAMKAEFDVKADAPDVQVGTITYVFQILR